MPAPRPLGCGSSQLLTQQPHDFNNYTKPCRLLGLSVAAPHSGAGGSSGPATRRRQYAGVCALAHLGSDAATERLLSLPAFHLFQ